MLRAEGRGFNAGVDIKEMQATEGFDALIGANRGCYAAFAAVYECAVPVIAAVNGYCLGGGIGLVGNADVDRRQPTTPPSGSPRSTAAPSAPPPTSPGSCPSTRCGRWCTRRPRPRPQELHALRLGARGRAAATSSATRPSRSPRRSPPSRPTVIRAAKESLNGIDLWDVKRSYRFEQGFTFELNLSGVADEHRDAFVAKRDTDTSR